METAIMVIENGGCRGIKTVVVIPGNGLSKLAVETQETFLLPVHLVLREQGKSFLTAYQFINLFAQKTGYLIKRGETFGLWIDVACAPEQKMLAIELELHDLFSERVVWRYHEAKQYTEEESTYFDMIRNAIRQMPV